MSPCILLSQISSLTSNFSSPECTYKQSISSCKTHTNTPPNPPRYLNHSAAGTDYSAMSRKKRDGYIGAFGPNSSGDSLRGTTLWGAPPRSTYLQRYFFFLVCICTANRNAEVTETSRQLVATLLLREIQQQQQNHAVFPPSRCISSIAYRLNKAWTSLSVHLSMFCSIF